MAEAAPGRVLVLGVLRIVDQSVDPVGAYPLVQLGTASPGAKPRYGSWSGMKASDPLSSLIRSPTVGPRWITGTALIVDEPISNSRSGKSWKWIRAGISSSVTGKRGGDRIRRVLLGETEPVEAPEG